MSAARGAHSRQQLAHVLSCLSQLYPTLALNRDWVQDAVEYIVSSTPGLSNAELNSQVHHQFLHADLSALVSPTCRTAQQGGFASLLPPASSPAATREPKKSKGEPNTPSARKIRGPLLVQIVGITDIGVSKQTLLDITRARLVAQQTAAGRKLLADDAADTKVQHARPIPTETQEEGPKDMTAEEEEAIATGIKYPRSMLLLELDDGIGITAEERAQQLDAGPCVLAVEMERLEGLRMGSTMLGCKLILQDVEVREDKILLRNDQVQILGGGVFELQGDWEKRYAARLERDLGLQPSVAMTATVYGRNAESRSPTWSPRHRPNGNARQTKETKSARATQARMQPTAEYPQSFPAHSSVVATPVECVDDSVLSLDEEDDDFFATVSDEVLRPRAPAATPPVEPIVLSD